MSQELQSTSVGRAAPQKLESPHLNIEVVNSPSGGTTARYGIGGEASQFVRATTIPTLRDRFERLGPKDKLEPDDIIVVRYKDGPKAGEGYAERIASVQYDGDRMVSIRAAGVHGGQITEKERQQLFVNADYDEETETYNRASWDKKNPGAIEFYVLRGKRGGASTARDASPQAPVQAPTRQQPPRQSAAKPVASPKPTDEKPSRAQPPASDTPPTSPSSRGTEAARTVSSTQPTSRPAERRVRPQAEEAPSGAVAVGNGGSRTERHAPPPEVASPPAAAQRIRPEAPVTAPAAKPASAQVDAETPTSSDSTPMFPGWVHAIGRQLFGSAYRALEEPKTRQKSEK